MDTMMTNVREVTRIIHGQQVSDGAGVQLRRIIGSHELDMLDPFLMFDAFGSDQPQDYIAGFPPHPHRGFETVTYMLAGKMRHEDSAGHAGVIESGGVQWMSAGSGIIHSEMPEQEQGLLAGFQLWVNLPASAKMSKPRYQEHRAEDIPVEQHSDGSLVRVVAGKTKAGTRGIIDNTYVDPIYWVVETKAGASFHEYVPQTHNAFVYVVSGQIQVGNSDKEISPGQLALLDNAVDLLIESKSDSQFLVIGGKPLNEPVARGGPFVMNSREQVEQAFSDYRSGQFANQ